MINKTYTQSIILLFSFFTLLSCKKDEFVNLSATISGESSKLGAEEGGSVIANVLLTEELSEDLPIQLSIKTDDILPYINDNDYDPTIEYSNDLGKTWKKALNQKVIFEERNLNLKIRINTHDDQRIEFHEEFDLVFSPDPSSEFLLSGKINPIRVTIEDNEPSNSERLLGALYEVDENYNLTLIGLNRKALFNEAHKAMIDEGLDSRLIADVAKVTQSGAIQITKFEALYDDSGLGGFVFNQSSDGHDEWYMGLNLLFAYNSFGDQGLKPIDYNSNGLFGSIITHEYGHILTLNQQKEINSSETTDACEEFSLWEGCFHKNSVLNQFSEAFYESETEYNEPLFVTDYAESNIAEDIAESFAYQVLQDTINPITEESSGALRKMHFVANHPHLSEFRDKIRNVLSNTSTTDIEKPIREFNYTKEGHRISCTNHQAILKAARKKQFKTFK